ncbi:MAG: FAD-dependent oxidoreductase, partial [Armatimonadota bacterium]|nr:FAD-dependent oxidoreductase [Armatimonadota bacterium]
NQRVSEGKRYSQRLARWVGREPNLRLYLNTHATGVEMAGARIAAVTALEVGTGRRLRFPAPLFIDATGDGSVGAAAGAEYRQGKEPRALHGEPWAPEEPSPHTMGNGLKYYHHDVGIPQPFTAPSWVYRFETCEAFAPGRHPRFITSEEIDYQWIFELGGLQDTCTEAEEIRDDLLRLVYGLWDHTKNHCPRDRERAATHRLVWVGHVAGKRESRRLMGDYVLTQNDIVAQNLFADRVAYGAWTIDDHHSEGFFHQGSFGRHYDEPHLACRGLPYSIPFRSLYSRNVENLLMAGRNISVTHLALANTRVMLTCAVIGQAAGTAAALCVAHQTTPRGVYQHHLEELQQQLLKDGAYLIGLPNRDPRDMARRAQVSASSVAIGGPDAPPPHAENIINGFARAEGGRANAWLPNPHACPPHWVELSWPTPISLNVVHVVFQTAALAPRAFALEVWRDGGWERVWSTDQNSRRRRVIPLARQTTRRLRVVLPQPCGICEVRVYDEPSPVVESARRVEAAVGEPDTGPFLPWEMTPASITPNAPRT